MSRFLNYLRLSCYAIGMDRGTFPRVRIYPSSRTIPLHNSLVPRSLLLSKGAMLQLQCASPSRLCDQKMMASAEERPTKCSLQLLADIFQGAHKLDSFIA